MESTKAVVTKPSGDVIEAVIVKGDLSQLTPGERVAYYKATCESLGLNPLTKPFEYITLNGRLTLYARKDATDQLRKLHGISIAKLEREQVNGAYVVTATATDRDGRTDTSIGAVAIEGLKGDAACNAMMKAESKAKRRVTLSLVGLGWTDETEIETIPGARTVVVDAETGKIEEPETPRVNFAWSEAAHGDSTVGDAWILKAAQATSLSTEQVKEFVGDLRKYGSMDAAKAALMAKITEATAR
jgi:hypothetical protein